MQTYVQRTNAIAWLLNNSKLENLYFAFAEFFMILVSGPEKTTVP